MANPNPSPATRLSDAQDHCDPDDKLCPLAQLRRIQRVLFRRSQKDDVEDKALPAIACAWERLEGRKAILTMRPAPKPIDVSDRQKARKRKPAESAWADPSAPEQPKA